jgi:CelD/BcsL family acetyltransferase involved in cellulose biosynthesis
MRVEQIHPGDDRWEEFVQRHPDGSIFHSGLWARLLITTYGYVPCYSCITDPLGRIEAGMPAFLVRSIFTGARMIGVPFADYCDPLFDEPEQFELLLGAALRQAKAMDLDYVEFRSKNRIDVFSSQAVAVLQREDDNVVHILELAHDLNAVRKRFETRQLERNIRKALNSDLEVSASGGERDLKAFYELEVMTRKRKGLPPQPYRFFKNLWNLFSANQSIHVLVAREGAEPVSSLLLANYKDTMHYLYGGSNRDRLSKRPNHLLLWKAIEMTHGLRLRFFDFGRTGRDNPGLLTFKKSWGSKETGVAHFTYSKRNRPRLLMNRTRGIHDFAHKTTSMLPSGLLKVVGAMIYRHLG